jgi:hypothetical protein
MRSAKQSDSPTDYCRDVYRKRKNPVLPLTELTELIRERDRYEKALKLIALEVGRPGRLAQEALDG